MFPNNDFLFHKFLGWWWDKHPLRWICTALQEPLGFGIAGWGPPEITAVLIPIIFVGFLYFEWESKQAGLPSCELAVGLFQTCSRGSQLAPGVVGNPFDTPILMCHSQHVQSEWTATPTL